MRLLVREQLSLSTLIELLIPEAGRGISLPPTAVLK